MASSGARQAAFYMVACRLPAGVHSVASQATPNHPVLYHSVHSTETLQSHAIALPDGQITTQKILEHQHRRVFLFLAHFDREDLSPNPNVRIQKVKLDLIWGLTEDSVHKFVVVGGELLCRLPIEAVRTPVFARLDFLEEQPHQRVIIVTTFVLGVIFWLNPRHLLLLLFCIFNLRGCLEEIGCGLRFGFCRSSHLMGSGRYRARST